MAVADILLQERHIGFHAAVDDDGVILLGNDDKRHHERAGFGELI